MVVELSRLIKFGNSYGIILPPKFLASCRWNVGDRIAIRYAEGKLILDRVPMEGLAKLKAGETDG